MYIDVAETPDEASMAALIILDLSVAFDVINHPKNILYVVMNEADCVVKISILTIVSS